VVEAIARRLGWGFVTIDTSAFLAGGLGNVAARITEVSTAQLVRNHHPSLPCAPTLSWVLFLSRALNLTLALIWP